jgi:hypothetical protein
MQADAPNTQGSSGRELRYPRGGRNLQLYAEIHPIVLDVSHFASCLNTYEVLRQDQKEIEMCGAENCYLQRPALS